MLKKTLVILFANDTIVSVFPTKVKALLPIGNIPCLCACIKSFLEALKENIDFFIVILPSSKQEIQTEIIRWHPREETKGVEFFFHEVETSDHRFAYVLRDILTNHNLEHYTSVLISDCSFPLLGNQVVKMLFEKTEAPYALVGDFSHRKFNLSRRLLEGVTLSSENVLEFPILNENNKTYEFYFMNIVHLSFLDFCENFQSVADEKKSFISFLPWKALQLPLYYMSFEGIPFMLCNDRIYLDNLYWKRKNVEHLQYINNIWMKWNNVSHRLRTIEKKIENLKNLSNMNEKNKS